MGVDALQPLSPPMSNLWQHSALLRRASERATGELLSGGGEVASPLRAGMGRGGEEDQSHKPRRIVTNVRAPPKRSYSDQYPEISSPEY